jgi:hypothetical protein
MTSDPMRKDSFGGTWTRRHCPVKEEPSKRYRSIVGGTVDIIPFSMKDGSVSAHNGTVSRIMDHEEDMDLIYPPL